MRVTEELIKIFDSVPTTEAETGRDWLTNGLQAVFDHLFPEPGTNPLAQCAPDRDTGDLRRLRNVLLQADHSEMAIRGALRSGFRQDPETAEILTAVSNVRRVLEPWRMAGTESLNGEY